MDHLRLALGDPAAIAATAVRVTIIYAALLVGLHVAGRRTLGTLTPFDLVTLLLLSNAVQNAMIGPDQSLVGGLVGAALLLGLNHVVARAGFLRRSIEGTPTLLVHQGVVLAEALAREGIQADELLGAIREHGVAGVRDVETAVLEMDGAISIIPRASTVHRLKQVRSRRSKRLPKGPARRP